MTSDDATCSPGAPNSFFFSIRKLSLLWNKFSIEGFWQTNLCFVTRKLFSVHYEMTENKLLINSLRHSNFSSRTSLEFSLNDKLLFSELVSLFQPRSRVHYCEVWSAPDEMFQFFFFSDRRPLRFFEPLMVNRFYYFIWGAVKWMRLKTVKTIDALRVGRIAGALRQVPRNGRVPVQEQALHPAPLDLRLRVGLRRRRRRGRGALPQPVPRVFQLRVPLRRRQGNTSDSSFTPLIFFSFLAATVYFFRNFFGFGVWNVPPNQCVTFQFYRQILQFFIWLKWVLPCLILLSVTGFLYWFRNSTLITWV